MIEWFYRRRSGFPGFEFARFGPVCQIGSSSASYEFPSPARIGLFTMSMVWTIILALGTGQGGPSARLAFDVQPGSWRLERPGPMAGTGPFGVHLEEDLASGLFGSLGDG